MSWISLPHTDQQHKLYTPCSQHRQSRPLFLPGSLCTRLCLLHCRFHRHTPRTPLTHQSPRQTDQVRMQCKTSAPRLSMFLGGKPGKVLTQHRHDQTDQLDICHRTLLLVESMSQVRMPTSHCCTE